MPTPAAIRDGWELMEVLPSATKELFEAHHAYRGISRSTTYTFGVLETHGNVHRIVAAFIWQPPPIGCAKAVLPRCPGGVLSLSRMVAIPREERRLKHLSKPLRQQMIRLIDRTRWPALVTFSDEGLGHVGNVYKCSGWQATARTKTANFEDVEGRRTSRYAAGVSSLDGLVRAGWSVKQRWEHHIVPPNEAAQYMANNGWQRVEVPGRVWASGNPAYTWRKIDT